MQRLTFISVCLLLSIPCGADTIIVDPNGFEDYTSIQDAIDNSSNGDVIEVQPGVYYERINFYGKAITISSIDPNNINVVYATVIDGGLSGNTVTFDSGEDNSSIIVGLTIQNGDTGVYCYYSDPLISNCIVRYTKGKGDGYGSSAPAINGSSASPTIIECIIRENTGPGISTCDGEISDCEVSENSSYGMYSCDGPIKDCLIIGNTNTGLYSCQGPITGCVASGNSGNGLSSCNGQISNCLVSGNLSDGLRACSGHITNCTVLGNKGDGVDSCSTIQNNIIVQNWCYGIRSSTVLKYNDVWGNLSGNYSGVVPGQTDTHENPLFAVEGYWDADDMWVEGEYHLKSVAGRWNPNSHIWINDAVTSPCIDAGDPTGGYFYEPEPNGGRINQGAYGGTICASKSPYGPEPYCGKYIPGDANLDCKIDFTDFAIIASHWLECNLVPESACWE